MKTLIKMNQSLLQQAIGFLESVDDSQYKFKAEHCFNSSIGGHIRHHVDHYFRFLEGLKTGRIDYDARSRDPEIETCSSKAVEALANINEAFTQMLNTEPPKIWIKINEEEVEEDFWCISSVQRELQFLISHGVHHFALIVSIGSILGLSFPENFGMAPSTIDYRKSLQV